RTVWIESAQVAARQFGQLGERTDAREVIVGTTPDRQRCAPKAVARKGPVDVVGEPVTESTVADMGGVPIDRRVLAQHLLAELTGRDVPVGLSPVDQYRAAAPAVRQRVGVGETTEQDAAAFEFVVDRVVGTPYALTFEPVDRRGERPVGSDGVHGRQSV